jgi:type IX secretion system PorP/SprF family membrane protein
MNCGKMILVIMFLLLMQRTYAQQSPLYSQYLFNMTTINPAYAGDTALAGVNLLYRRQWIADGGVKGAPKTFSGTWLHKRGEESSVGYGVQVYNDKIGIENSTGIQGFYSYRIKFDRSAFTMGLSGGIVNYRANFAQVATLEPSDPAFMKNVNGWLPTFGAGILYQREKWYAAFSAPALLTTKFNDAGKSDVTSRPADNHYFLNLGYNWRVDHDVVLKPSVAVRAVSGAPAQFDFSFNAEFYEFCNAGFSYRTGDEYVGLIQFRASKTITIGYAYDYITALSHYSRSAHEFMFRFRTGK